MWSTRKTGSADGRMIKCAIDFNASAISYAGILELWRDSAEFRVYFNQLLVDFPFTAFRWETPPVTIATLNQPFEFVLLDSPELRSPSISPPRKRTG